MSTVSKVGVGNEMRTKIAPWRYLKNSTRYSNDVEDYWPCTSGLSAVNAIGTQLRDPTNSGLTRWRLSVKMDAVEQTKWEEPREKAPFLSSPGFVFYYARKNISITTLDIIKEDKERNHNKG